VTMPMSPSLILDSPIQLLPRHLHVGVYWHPTLTVPL
jgi:hypothetical protein